MVNYNIECDLIKIDGAEVDGGFIRIPIDNEVGTVTDAYFAEDPISGEMNRVRRKGVILKLTALGPTHDDTDASHLIKPGFSAEHQAKMTKAELRRVRWIGNMKPWFKPGTRTKIEY